MNNRGSSFRYNNYHTPKRQLLGNAGPAPAWRNGPTPGASGSGPRADSGSKILVTNLPFDVSPEELKHLFEKTVGPTREHYLIHNNQGRSKGQAVVHFARGADASIARQKYNGKMIDGRLKLKVEIVIDSDAPEKVAAAATASQPSLLARLAPTPTAPQANAAPTKGRTVPAKQQQPAPVAKKQVQPIQIPVGGRRRQKKGPKRIAKQKRPPVDFASLDQEMDEYRAGAPADAV